MTSYYKKAVFSFLFSMLALGHVTFPMAPVARAVSRQGGEEAVFFVPLSRVFQDDTIHRLTPPETPAAPKIFAKKIVVSCISLD